MTIYKLLTSIKKNVQLWHSGALPGLVVVGFVLLIRLTGILQTLEWMVYDKFWLMHPLENTDKRVVVIGINEDDITYIKDYPLTDDKLGQLLKTIESYEPRTIGLDIFQTLKSSSEGNELAKVLTSSQNIFTIHKVLGNGEKLQVEASPGVPIEQVGFADIIVDADGKLRRVLLASEVKDKTICYSLALLLARHYLQAEGIQFKHGQRVTMPMSFNNKEIPRFTKNTGAYVRAQDDGYQTLLNFRSNSKPFSTISLSDIFNGKVKPELIRDRIVIIGMTAIVSSGGTFMSDSVRNTAFISNPPSANTTKEDKFIYSVEVQAHATSQIISNILDGRLPMRTWSEGIEYLWIFGWGLWGMALGLMLQSPWKTLPSIAISSLALTAMCYGLLISSLWVPVVPSLMALVGAGLTTSLFDRGSKALLEQRSLTLRRTYDAVHNGPLQTLAAILRSDLPTSELREQLQELNQELRDVFELMNQSLLYGENQYLNTPLTDLLYQVYDNTLRRNLPGFSTIRTYIPPDFSPLQDCSLTPEQKQSMCIFLQEALCNVGKHAVDATLLDVVCKYENKKYYLGVIDNGITDWNSNIYYEGRGSIQAIELARNLGGRFQRKPRKPCGTVCELTWYQRRFRFWK